MIRILNIEPSGYSSQATNIFKELGELVELNTDRAGLLSAIEDFDVLVTRLGMSVDEEIIEAGSRLKAIVTPTTGLDHIDLDAATRRGVNVISLRGEVEFLSSIPATAEHTWALLLALLRRIPSATRSVLEGIWDRDGYRGSELRGKRLGLLGFGRVGRMVAGYGQAFGMEVSAHDPKAIEAKSVTDLDFRELMSSSDVLSIHVPLNDATRRLVGSSELALLPRGAVLVNTSRGEVLDEGAVVDALNSGILAGAAVDVIEHERDPNLRRQSPLLAYAQAHDNLLITPHLAGATTESMARTEVFVAQKLATLMGGPNA